MKFKFYILFLLFFLLTNVEANDEPHHFSPGTNSVYIAKNATGIRTDLLKNIAPIIKKSIAQGNYPGAVVLISHRGQIIYRGVFGNRRIIPSIAPMKFNTIFDLASITKVFATTPAIMELVEQNKLELDAAVSKYWPAFAQNGKSAITIRELLTHTSGLPPDIPIRDKSSAKKCIEAAKLIHAPGTTFVYSDVNFITLGYLVEIASGEPLNHYATTHVFKPLGLKDTGFLPSPTLKNRIAPTELIDKKLRWGMVHDPTTYAMGGVSGAAGVFSTASDLGKYAQMILNGGSLFPKKNKNKNYLLGPLTIEKMTTPQTPAEISDTRGLGWDVDSCFSNRGILFPVRSFGHTGWTGTSIWIDPITQTWIIILTSRTHPIAHEKNQVIEDRRSIATIIAASITDIVPYRHANTGIGELHRAFASK